jgi:hypothetical protein
MVPSLPGLPFSEVPMTLSTAELTLGNVSRVYDPMYDPNVVIAS